MTPEGWEGFTWPDPFPVGLKAAIVLTAVIVLGLHFVR